MFSVWSLITSLLLVVGHSQAGKVKRPDFAVAQEKAGRISVNNEVNMIVKIDAGWYSFAYGKQGQMAFRSFGIYNSNVVQLSVTSCFCPGNFFSIYDNGQPIMMTNITVPIVTVKANHQEILLNCTNPVPDPNLCVLEPGTFSQGSVLLLPGRHNITIVANQSPWGGGTAFLRADSACPSPINMAEPVPCCLATGTCSRVIVA